jgi:hypothetical protein
MEFWQSSEASHLATPILIAIDGSIAAAINQAIGTSALMQQLDVVETRYIPIVMSARFDGRFPARSRANHKQRIYNCCPRLDYDAFVNGTPAQRIAIYLDGLQDCSTCLKKLGATPAQVAEFQRIVRDLKGKLMAEANQTTA